MAKHHLNHLKLYFMIGLPAETDDDIEDIIKLTLSLKGFIDRKKSRSTVTLTVEPFVPKAGTPFQWLPMASVEILTHRLSTLKNGLKPKGIQITSESVNWMIIQGVLSRGDTRLAQVLAKMENKTLSSWHQAMEQCSLNPGYYVNREIPLGERLPWSNIDSGVSKDYLISELDQARLGEETPPCPLAHCQKCGVC